MRRAFWLLGAFVVILFASKPIAAQDKIELFGGYSYARLNPGGVNVNGWEASGTLNSHHIFGLTADVSGHYGSGLRLTSFLFGPQISLPTPILHPFVHALFGGMHQSVPSTGFSDNAFAAAIGGGIDMKVLPLISIRPIQIDYFPTRFSGQTQNNTRISGGVVVHF